MDLFLIDYSHYYKCLISNDSINIKQQPSMTYPFIAVGLIAVFIAYILYLLLIKKDFKTFRSVIYPGLLFIVIWGIIFYFLLK